MLATLQIKNLALVEDLTLELQQGYNVITGETGAGKSILIGALSLVLGERADRGSIREGAEACSVEAVFEIESLSKVVSAILERHGLDACQDGQLLLKRVFTASGANRQFVNGCPTTLSVLGEVGQVLVDIHGPHDHQSLLHPSRQLTILDAFGKLGAVRESYAALVRRRSEVQAEKSALVIDERTYLQEVELLRHQVREISAANLKPDEDEQVQQDYHRASNSARLLQLTRTALGQLAEDEVSILSQAEMLGRTLHELQRIDASAASVADLHSQAIALLRELHSAIADYSERVELDPELLQKLEERLNLLQALKRKYGPQVSDVIGFGHDAAVKLAGLEQRDATLAKLNNELNTLESQAWAAGQSLSQQRRKVIPELNKAVGRQLAALGFKQSRFEVQLVSPTESQFKQHLAQASASGTDTIEFQFCPNPGEPLRPLRAIASSGELARVMLALKTVLADEDEIPVLVFDEVDANVGGETAIAVGEKMRQIARKRQVLCITHLPQVAASASAHFVVTKQTRSGRTTSNVALLEQNDRVSELARMLGGQSEASRRHAEALLKK